MGLHRLGDRVGIRLHSLMAYKRGSEARWEERDFITFYPSWMDFLKRELHNSMKFANIKVIDFELKESINRALIIIGLASI